MGDPALATPNANVNTAVPKKPTRRPHASARRPHSVAPAIVPCAGGTALSGRGQYQRLVWLSFTKVEIKLCKVCKHTYLLCLQPIMTHCDNHPADHITLQEQTQMRKCIAL